jgi:hypothetical protein
MVIDPTPRSELADTLFETTLWKLASQMRAGLSTWDAADHQAAKDIYNDQWAKFLSTCPSVQKTLSFGRSKPNTKPTQFPPLRRAVKGGTRWAD